MNNERVRKENRPHRDEMNLVEFPIGIVSERVPLDPSTGQEVRELVMERTISEGGQVGDAWEFLQPCTLSSQ